MQPLHACSCALRYMLICHEVSHRVSHPNASAAPPVKPPTSLAAQQVKLKQMIVLKAEGHKKKIKNTVSKRSYPGIPKYTTLQGGLARCAPGFTPLSLAVGLPFPRC